MALSLLIAAASLFHLGDSWRVGVLEEQKTQLVTTGIYAHSRNPYFVSYIIMFAAYTILAQSAILLAMLLASVALIHAMIKKEEQYLLASHGQAYEEYMQNVGRYLFI